jgi:CubicO group peptidase (beta-lactamase class C family)
MMSMHAGNVPQARRQTMQARMLKPVISACAALMLGFLGLTTGGSEAQAQAWQARHGLTSSQYQATFSQLTSQGYRLVQVDGYDVSNQSRYAAIWEKKIGPAWVARHGMTSTQYQSEFNKYVGQGYRLVLVDGHTVGGQDRYAAIWEKKSGPTWVARHGMTGAQYQSEFNTYVGQGYRLMHVSGYGGNSARYAAIWEKKTSPAWVARHGMSSAQYQSEFNKYVGQGYRLVLVDGYTVGGQDRYAAIWAKTGGPPWAARHLMTGTQYQGEFNNYYYQGFRLRSISGYSLGSTARYAAIWESQALSGADLAKIESKISTYMKTNGIPGLSVAITKGEKLVYARGFGFADQANGVKVNPIHRFRVASVSKPITSIAVMKLIQDGVGNLGLGRTVFGNSGVLGTTFGNAPYHALKNHITVQHLLEHTSGWDNNPSDIMFDGSGMTQAQLIGEMLDNRNLATSPGTNYLYLNFGYCTLGRIIEALGNESYESWVRKNVLAPANITRMEIAGNTLADRKADEVVYYGGNPYSMPVARMDAHGGWLASPIDMTRLLVRVDGNPGRADILNATSRATMLTASTQNSGYAKGWGVDSSSQGHNGAFAGSIAFAWIRNDGHTAAVFANTRPSGDGFAFGMRGVVDDLINEVTTWPTWDMF